MNRWYMLEIILLSLMLIPMLIALGSRYLSERERPVMVFSCFLMIVWLITAVIRILS